MGKPFDTYDYDDAKKLFNTAPDVSGLTDKAASLGGSPRRPLSAKAARAFYDDDHWQGNKGFGGQLPHFSIPGAAQIEADIKKRFVGENAIQEVVETHIGGVLGREPLWSFLSEEGKPEPKKGPKAGGTTEKTFEQKTGEMLTPWWNEREALVDLQKSAETLVLEAIAVRRLFFPKGRLPGNNELPRLPDLSAALDFIFFETLTADVAGVFKDPDTQYEIGVWLFEEKDNEGEVIANCAELSYLDVNGDTVCKVVKDKGAPEEFGPFRLGGRLLLHEMQRRPLITEQVQSQQRALNLAHTKLMRNVDMAGARERTVSNAQTPKKRVKVQDPNNSARTHEVDEPGVHETGGGAVMYLMGYPIRNDDGVIVGYTQPNVDVTDPSPVEAFTGARSNHYEAILGQCHQRHILISGDATASGQSRKQAEKAFQRSLKKTKTPLDASGRWQLETTLRLAAQLIGQSEKYLALRADFNCLFDIGEPDPDDRRIVMEMRKPGGPNNQPLISDETARNWAGIDDAASELAKVEAEAPTDEEIAARQAVMQPANGVANGDAEVVN